MGGIIEAHCKCGFESGAIYAGGGMSNFLKVCNAPAICLNCNIFLIENYIEKHSKCPKCREKVTFYNDPKVQEQVSESYETYNDIFSWNINDEKGEFRLPNTRYYCPGCNEMTMEFLSVGNWD